MTQGYKLSVYVKGLKKRDRKIKTEFHTVSKLIPLNEDRNTINQTVKSYIATNFKEVMSDVSVHLDFVELKTENGVVITQWEPFGDKNIKYKLERSSL